MKEHIRDGILELGADVCGFASVDRFSNAPKGFQPLDIYEECKTIIVFAVALPKDGKNGICHIKKYVYSLGFDHNSNWKVLIQ